MPDLTDWVEAQLKRGYSMQQINSYLARRGYQQYKPSSASQASQSAQPGKAKAKKLKLPALLALAALAVVGLALLLLADRFQQLPNPGQPSAFLPAQEAASFQPSSETKSASGTLSLYAGTVEDITPTAVMLRQGNAVKEFPILASKPFRYITGYGKLSNGSYQHYQNATYQDVKKGDELQIFLMSDASGSYIARVYISRPAEEFVS